VYSTQTITSAMNVRTSGVSLHALPVFFGSALAEVTTPTTSRPVATAGQVVLPISANTGTVVIALYTA